VVLLTTNHFVMVCIGISISRMKKTEDLTHINHYTILADESATFNHN
jgi:hypothetical protein